MEKRKLSRTIVRTEQSMKQSFDKIFQELEKTLHGKPNSSKSSSSHKSLESNSSALPYRRHRIRGEKEFKKSFSRNWRRVGQLHQIQAENRKNVNQVLRKRSKTIIKKWQKDLVDIKLQSDKLKKETKKLNSLLQSIPDITNREGRVTRLHHHFRNSQRYVQRQHGKNLRDALDDLRKTSTPL